MQLRIYVPNSSEQKIGGGWTFVRNLAKAIMRRDDCDLAGSVADCDVMLIAGATMTPKEEVRAAKAAGKKIVLRVDNLPRESRNRGTAFSRLKEYADTADAVVYQSRWAQEYVGYFLHSARKPTVIYNGVDGDIFFDNGIDRIPGSYLYVQYNRDENKRWTEAAMLFHYAYRKDKSLSLTVLGNFSPELIDNRFDFVDGEQVHYVPPCSPEMVAGFMRSHQTLLFPAYGDAAPNTVLEALACGMGIAGINEFGGTKEMLDLKGRTIQQMANEYIDLFKSL